MKKAIIITLAIVLFSAVMVACNIDATLGIYSEVAQSTPSTDVVLREYLGYDTANSKYFYLSDEGVYTLSSGTTKKIIASDDNQRVVGAFMESSTKLYVLVESKDKDKMGETTLLYSSDAGENFNEKTTGLKGMLSNGFCWDDHYIYYMKEGELYEFTTETCVSIKILTSLSSSTETDSYAFFSVNEELLGGTTNRFYVLKYGKSTPEKNFEGDSTYYCGFQCVGSDYYLLYKDTSKNLSYVYKINDGDKIEQFVKLNFNLKFSKTQNATFYAPEYGKLVVKCSTYFDEVDLSTKKVESVKNKYASNICTADITNFKWRDGAIYIVGTVNSMLYSIDMEHPDNTPVAIK